MPARVVVTGAGGFIGANLVRRAVRDGHEVTAFVRPAGSRWRLEGMGNVVDVRELDVRDGPAVDRALRGAGPDWVLHCAAHGAYSWETDFERMLETNVLATDHLLRAAADAGCSAFVHAGTSSEYGYKDHPAAEDEPIAPNSRYAVTKAAASALCAHVSRERGLPVTTLRLYSAYGPWEDPRRLVPTLIARGMHGELPPLVEPDTARDFVFVEDVAEAFVLAAGAARPGGALYNVCSGRQTTVREIVEVARRVLAIEREPAWGSAEARGWDTTVWVGDSARVRAETGWAPAHDLEQGFRRTVDWLRATGEVHGRYGVAAR